jgi:hypothetical protein
MVSERTARVVGCQAGLRRTLRGARGPGGYAWVVFLQRYFPRVIRAGTRIPAAGIAADTAWLMV